MAILRFARVQSRNQDSTIIEENNKDYMIKVIEICSFLLCLKLSNTIMWYTVVH